MHHPHRSASPGKEKPVSLVEEGLRRLRGTPPSLVPPLQLGTRGDSRRRKRAVRHRPVDLVLFVPPPRVQAGRAEEEASQLEVETGGVFMKRQLVRTWRPLCCAKHGTNPCKPEISGLHYLRVPGQGGSLPVYIAPGRFTAAVEGSSRSGALRSTLGRVRPGPQDSVVQHSEPIGMVQRRIEAV